jgi:hypothetical protein
MKIHTTVVASALTLAVAASARANVSMQVIDVGTPQIPTSLDPSGYLQGYTGYIIRFVSDSDTISAFDFGIGNPGAIYGSFAQRWTSSTGNALSGGSYDTFSPGPSAFNNSSPSLWNADSHFLGSAGLSTTNVLEDAAFQGTSN